MKKQKWIALTAAAAVLVCAAVGIRGYLAERNAGDIYQDVKEEASKETEPEEEPEKEEKKPVEIPIDFQVLQDRNPEVYAWIRIPDTAVDYPILQSETDNSYYLDHTIDGTESIEGAIFTEDYNAKDFEDPNTVIYGHDMKNGSMFCGLLDYQDREYFEAHRDIIIYTPDAIRHYWVFAAYVYDDRHIMQSFDFDNAFVYRQYLERIFGKRDMNAHIDTAAEVGTEDNIITLSTCYGAQDNSRYLVQAVLVSIEQ